MSARTGTIWIVLIAFSLLCAWAVSQQGYLAVWTVPFEQPVTFAVGVDLAIVLGLGCLWMLKDATQHGRNVWSYIALTATCGSIGLLLYLALAGGQRTAPVVATTSGDTEEKTALKGSAPTA